MEKQVNDKGGGSVVEHEEHHPVHSENHEEDKHPNKEQNSAIVDGEDKEKSTPRDTHDDEHKVAIHQSQEIPSLHEKHASNNKDAGATHAPSDKMDTHVKLVHGNEDVGMPHELEGTSAAYQKPEHRMEHAHIVHEPPESLSYGSSNKDTDMIHASIEKTATHGKVSHDHEVAAVTSKHKDKSAKHEEAIHDNEHVDLAHEFGERHKTHEQATHDGEHVGLTHESGEKHETQGKHTDNPHDEHVGLTHESGEIHETHGKHTDNPHDEHVGLTHESGEIHETHGKHTDNPQDVEGLQEMSGRPEIHKKLTHLHKDGDSTLQAKPVHDGESGHTSHPSNKRSPMDGEHRPGDEDVNMYPTPENRSLKPGDNAGVANEHEHKQRCDALHAGTLQERGENCRSVDDECESRKAFSDESSLRERIHFSRGSTPDKDTPTQCSSSPSNDTKPPKSSSTGLVNADRGPGSADGNLETPSTSWAFSGRASIAPSKFDHMATLRILYTAYKESKQGKEGVPLSLLPEILESARFMVPPPRDLVPLLQRIDIEYKSGDLVKWSLLQNLALQIERKEARYPSVFIPRSSLVRPNSNSPSSWKALQRSPTRRTHPEDDYPELEPQVYEMMKEIDNHRRKSAKEGNYLAADAAAQRLLELKLFEDNKRRATMLERHAQEREQAEKAYKGELQERNQLWDERLKNFHKEVVEHAQRLKQQHIATLHHFKEKMASKTPVKAPWSRELLKQRRIQVYLGRQGKYLEAQEVKQSADRMEQAELQAAIAAFQAELIGKEQTVRVKQQTEMDILLQRAARTREEIRKSRTLDLQRCHQRHKNVMRELAAIQKQEVFRFDQLMQKKVQNPYTGVGFGGQRVAQSPSARARISAQDYSTDDALYSGGEDSSMKD